MLLLATMTSAALGCGPSRPDASVPTPVPGSPGATARQAVADHLSVPIEQTRLLQLEAVVFPDASLGCPEPGFGYAQVVTPGYRAQVEADGRQFDVRVAGKRGRICERPGAADPGGPPADR